MSRLQRTRSKSGYYHIMLRGNEKKDIFKCEEDKLRFIDTIYRMKQGNRFYLHAFCLMDNHIHMMISEREEDIAKVIKRITVSYVFYFNKKYKRVGHLFQDRYKSEVVSEDGYALTLVRYIHKNPVKAGMVKEMGNYRWSSYNGYLDEEDYSEKVIDTEIIMGMLSEDKKTARALYIKYMAQESEENYLDIVEKVDMMDEEEALKLYGDMLRARGLRSVDTAKDQDLRDLLSEYKKATNFSIRKMAVITGLNKDKLSKLLRNIQ